MRRISAIILASTLGMSALAQPPGGGNREGGGERKMRFEKGGGGGEFGGRRMMMGGNMDEMFDRFSKGKDVIRRDDLDPMMQMGFDMMARRLNITGNEITRDQAKQFGEQMQSRMREGGGGMGGMGGGGINPDMAARFTEEGFRRRDRNGDGLLDANEMSDGLKSERDKWDTNKDGFIDLNEYKAYASARFADQRGPGNPSSETPTPTQPTIVPQTPVDGDPENRRPVVFRFGYLPKELPEWFAQLDIDSDGQVALHEWIKGSRTVEKFREMDSNDDDFIIAEEVIRFQNGGKITNYNIASAYNSDNREPAYRSNRDNGGGRGRGAGGGGGGDRNAWWGGGNRSNGDSNNNGGGRPNWMNGGGGGPGGWGNRGPGGNGNNGGGDRPRGPGGGMEKGMSKGGFEKGMGKGGRDRGGDRGNNGGNNNEGGRRP